MFTSQSIDDVKLQWHGNQLLRHSALEGKSQSYVLIYERSWIKTSPCLNV